VKTNAGAKLIIETPSAELSIAKEASPVMKGLLLL
jgi:hypothetical protein